MTFYQLDEEKVVEAAKAHFASQYPVLDHADFYLPDIETGKIMVDGVEHPFYVSTHYAYEDRVVKGNDTRYKVPLCLLYVKDDPYQIIYDSKDCCYVAYQQEDEIRFVLYVDFYDFVKKQIHLVEE